MGVGQWVFRFLNVDFSDQDSKKIIVFAQKWGVVQVNGELFFRFFTIFLIGWIQFEKGAKNYF